MWCSISGIVWSNGCGDRIDGSVIKCSFAFDTAARACALFRPPGMTIHQPLHRRVAVGGKLVHEMKPNAAGRARDGSSLRVHANPSQRSGNMRVNFATTGHHPRGGFGDASAVDDLAAIRMQHLAGHVGGVIARQEESVVITPISQPRARADVWSQS